MADGVRLSRASLVAYNLRVEIADLHDWHLTTAEAIAIQVELAGQVSRQNEVTAPRFIAGVDISVNRTRGTATGAVVVFSYPGLELIEVQTADGPLDFPYVPGLLTFREAPLTLARRYHGLAWLSRTLIAVVSGGINRNWNW